MFRFMLFLCLILFTMSPAADFQSDIIETSKGPLEITFIGHGTISFQWDGKMIHVDPWARLSDYTEFPPADLILITHEHGDHLDTDLLGRIVSKETTVIITKACAERFNGTVLNNGEKLDVGDIHVEAVPAYNITHKRSNGNPYHPKGRGNGYVLTFADTRVYVAGDTENIPEMADLKNIDVAFLPMNLPYTMSPEMAADAAKMVKPKILYPYHFGDTDVSQLEPLLAETNIEIRIRDLK